MQKQVGIDIEKIRPLAANLIKKYQLDQKPLYPISAWTQKEAVFKVIGEDNLNAIKQIQLHTNGATFKGRQYFINSLKLTNQYTMSIASLQPNTKIKVKRVYF